ncbi:MAG: hypothetical protein E4G94_02285, partial [ANME-2 cluster archaeon]
ELTGPYLGEKPPGTIPELFASEFMVLGKGTHSTIVFSADGMQAYWSYLGLCYSTMESGIWSMPKMLPFSRKEYNDDAPFLSPDGKQLFFTSTRPANDSDQSRKENIWVVDLIENGWSEPRLIPPIVNDMFQHWQVSVDLNGNLYFGYGPDEDSNKDIYSSKYVNGEYQKPEKLSGLINSETNDHNPYISPNGDFLIFSRTKDGRPFDGGLFISFKEKNGSWSISTPLRKYIKFKSAGNCAIITPDGKYLFYLDAYEGEWQRFWVSTELFIKRPHQR